MASPTTIPSARPFTYEDLEGIPDDEYRREIIGGSLVVNPAPDVFHQRVVVRLARLFDEVLPPELEAVVAPFDWRPDVGEVYEPDVLVVRVDDLSDRGFLRPGANPVLAVEVLSPNRIADLVTKRAAYAEAGLESYWVVDPSTGSLLVLRRGKDGTYEVEAEVDQDGTYDTALPFPVRVEVSALISRR